MNFCVKFDVRDINSIHLHFRMYNFKQIFLNFSNNLINLPSNLC